MAIDEITSSHIIELYEWYEQQVSDLLKFFPPQGDNLKTWSPRLATPLVESCSLIDSIFRIITPAQVKIGSQKKNRSNLGISDFAELYAQKHTLYERKAILLISPPKYIIPFKIWEPAKDNKRCNPPLWWTIHNKLKHNKLPYLHKATIEVTLEALCGLFILISILPSLIPAIIRYQWMGTVYSPQFIIREAQRGFISGHAFPVETNLFFTSVGRIRLPEKIEEINPEIYRSPRLISFLAKI